MKIPSIFILVILFLSCQNGNLKSVNGELNNTPSFAIEINSNGNRIVQGAEFPVYWSFQDSIKNIDSIIIYIDDKKYDKYNGNARNTIIKTKNVLVGRRKISIKAFAPEGYGKANLNLIVLSDIVPVQYQTDVLKTYPHSRESYTQGLIYRDGYFYESTGEYGHSALKKIKLETGAVEAMAKLESNIFAEGIAIKNGEIYQISWHEQVCFVYDMGTLQQKGRFPYEIREGWGLEFDGKNFLMTDGSNLIYFLNSESFAIEKRIEVMDTSGPVYQLNELELVNGQLYANIYMKERIVIIDPNSGKLIGNINASGLLKESDINKDTDVLNGIAYNPQNGHFFVTGKKWPKLFEVKFSPIKR